MRKMCRVLDVKEDKPPDPVLQAPLCWDKNSQCFAALAAGGSGRLHVLLHLPFCHECLDPQDRQRQPGTLRTFLQGALPGGVGRRDRMWASEPSHKPGAKKNSHHLQGEFHPVPAIGLNCFLVVLGANLPHPATMCKFQDLRDGLHFSCFFHHLHRAGPRGGSSETPWS